MARRAKVFVVTGPSGVGKGTLIERLLQSVPGVELSVSATTRKPRPGEVDGRDYHYLDPGDFERRVAAGEFLEHSEVDRRLATGTSVVLEIELQGARQVRTAMPESVQVFIAPPSPEALRERLERRGTDSEDAIAERLRVAGRELAAQREFAHVIVNDDVDRAAAELERTVREELALAPGRK